MSLSLISRIRLSSKNNNNSRTHVRTTPSYISPLSTKHTSICISNTWTAIRFNSTDLGQSPEEILAKANKIRTLPKEGEIFSEKVELLAEQVSKLDMVEMMYFLKATAKRVGIPFDMLMRPQPMGKLI